MTWTNLLTPEFLSNWPIFIKSDKIGRVTRIVYVTHGFGLAVFFMSPFFLRFYWLTIFFNSLCLSPARSSSRRTDHWTEDDRSRRGGVGQRGWSLWGGTGTGTEGGELCVHFTKGGGGEDDITAAKGGRGLADCLISQVRGSVVSGTRTLGP